MVDLYLGEIFVILSKSAKLKIYRMINMSTNPYYRVPNTREGRIQGVCEYKLETNHTSVSDIIYTEM